MKFGAERHFIDCDKQCNSHELLAQTVSEMRGASLAIAWIVAIFGVALLTLIGYGYLSLVEQDKEQLRKIDELQASQHKIDRQQVVIKSYIESMINGADQCKIPEDYTIER